MAANSMLALLIISWLVYFVLHSFFASLWLKTVVANTWPHAMPFYRLSFNVLALILILVPFYFQFMLTDKIIWEWNGISFWLAQSLALLAVVGFIYSLGAYDSGEFLGLRQIKERETKVEDQEHFRISKSHRYVRHPWYFFALVLIWTRDMYLGMFVTAVLATLYFIIGSLLEEKKLCHYYGDVYREYKRAVPGLIPLPFHFLSQEKAEELEAKANK